jgi:RNA polymerase sigma-70 factor (ECF subfamily)
MPSPTDPDGATFEQLRPRLTAISRRIVGSRAEAEDIVQDCYLKWHAARRAALATPAAWLTTVVQRQSIDRLRRRTRDEAAAQAASALGPGPAPALHEVFECSHADIAAVLGTKAANARQHLARARRRLRNAGSEDRGAPEEKQCRELVRRFQAAINGSDLPALLTLLADEQPVSVHAFPQPRMRAGACANDASYGVVLAA